jgi:uncharacterized membrane-anchored protein YhcB (DUF1043 family)
MVWLGIIIGFVTGVVVITLLYAPLVDKVEMLQQKLLREQQLIDDAIKTLTACEKQNEHLRQDLTVMQRMVPRELYAQFFDGPYRDN